MVYIEYLLCAIVVTFCSIKASNYIDMLDKRTKLSGAFLGGVLLSAVTSLPELFTSLSSCFMLDKPELCMGNILGSDLFNIAVLACLMLLFFKGFKNYNVSKEHSIVALLVCGMYVAIALNLFGILTFSMLNFSIVSVFILILYAIGVKHLAGDDSEQNDSDDNVMLSLKQIIIRFIIVSVLIVIFSIIITKLTDEISLRLNLGAGLAGAIFLGVATSLPEVVSTTQLFRIKNYNIGIGNIIGSNLFNFTILALADIVYYRGGVYHFADGKTVNLLIFGLLATPLMIIVMKCKNKPIRVIGSLAVIACYILFLTVDVRAWLGGIV